MNLTEKFLKGSTNPIRNIEWVVALMTFIGGTFVFTPLYEVQIAKVGLSPVAQALSSPEGIVLWALVLLIGSTLVMIGLHTNRPQLKYYGWYATILARLFQLLTTWLLVGFLPITWIYPFTIMLVMTILWAVAKHEVNTNGRH